MASVRQLTNPLTSAAAFADWLLRPPPPRQVEALLALTHGLKQVLEAARTAS